MESLNRTTPPATARPKNSSSSTAHAHQPSSSQQPVTMAPSARTVRGGTPTANRSTSKLVDDQKAATRPASRDSLKQKMMKKPEDAPRPSKADEVGRSLGSGVVAPWDSGWPANTTQQLKVLRTDFDSLRSHLTCKICDRLLYQPYTIACGHTYCYTVRTHTESSTPPSNSP